MTQRLFPISDLASGTFTNNGSNFFGQLDELVDSADGDITRVQSTDESELWMGLSSGADPLTSSDHIIRVNARFTSAVTTEQLAVILRQGGADLVSPPFFTLTTSYATYTYTLSGAEADSITDYGDLQLTFYLKNFTSAPLRITACEFVVPDAPTNKGPIFPKRASQRALLKR